MTKKTAKKPKWERRKYSHGFKSPSGKIFVPCDNASQNVDLGKVTRRFFVLGDPGQECSCAITQYGMNNAHLYPHRAYWIETTRTHHYVVDKIDSRGRWKHCVRYRHNQTEGIDEFDSPGGKARLLKDPDLTWHVRLRVPHKRKPQTDRIDPDPPVKPPKPRDQVVTPFSRDRWMRALRRQQMAQAAYSSASK